MSPVEALQPAIVLLGAATCAALASRAVKVSPLVGYIVAGIVIGPFGLNLLQDSDTTHILAELGVVFLLFDIGLHFSLREVRDSRRDILGLAPVQMLLCGAVFILGLRLIGLDWPISIAIGVAIALSSTAVVTRVLSDRGLGTCPLGRSSIAVLVFQDIVAIFLLIFAERIGGGENTEQLMVAMGVAAGQAALAFAAAALVGRFVVRPLFRTLAAAKVQELLTMTAVLIVVAAAAATGALGLSLTLGAFLAGMAISDTPYRHVIQTEVTPFRGLLLSFFFMNVGLMIDMPSVLGALPLVIGVALAILLTKTLFIFIAAKLNRWSTPGATQLAFLLAQGSEFTLIVLTLASIREGVSGSLTAVLIAATALSLAAGPIWTGIGMRVARYIARWQATHKGESDSPATQPTRSADVIVYGMTDAGRIAVDALSDNGIAFVALDSDPDRFVRASADGYDVSFGDASDLRLIKALGMDNPRAIVIGYSRLETARSMTPSVKSVWPDLKRFVAVATPEERDAHKALDMRAHITSGPMGAIDLAADLLRTLGIEDEKVAAWIEQEVARMDVNLDGEIDSDTTEEEQKEAA